MKRLLYFLLAFLLFTFAANHASAQQTVYWTLTCRTELYATASENAMCVAIAPTGQIVLLKTAQDDGWAHIEYMDSQTGMQLGGWFNINTTPTPPEEYDHTYANAQAETAARLDGFRNRVDLLTAARDFSFEGWVEEQFFARCIAVVDSNEIFMRVEPSQAVNGLDDIDHFVVYGYTHDWDDRTPVIGRLNATAFNEETKLPTAFEGVADYALGSPHVRIAPVFASAGVQGYDILLMPTSGIVQTDGGNGTHRVITGTLQKDMPLMDFVITDTGRRGTDDEYIMQIKISMRDNSFSQTFEISTREPDFSIGPFSLRDMNFDGYMDLDITVAMGATNRLSVVSLWLPDDRCFAQPLEDTKLCNYILDPQRGEIWSSMRDGWSYHESTCYVWEGNQLTPKMRGERYYTGDPDFVGERVTEFSPNDGSQTVLWDEQYPMNWYYSSYEWVERERLAVLDAVVFYDMLHQSPQYAVVANVDWVNLRHLERKSSESIGKINTGETVQILRHGCGEDQGWIRVLWNGRTGYIWHSYLNIM